MFTVHMTQSVIVLELQKPKEIITEPGLYFKIPFFQRVKYFSNQLLDNDSSPAEVITKDKKNLLIGSSSSEPCLTFDTGDKVVHKIFGEGIVIKTGNHKQDNEVTVAFIGGAGIKRLDLNYADLRKL